MTTIERVCLFCLVLVLVVAAPVAAQTETPQPLGMPDVVLPTQQMFEQLATLNAVTGDTPDDLTRPEGLPVLPDEDGTRLFGYVKWLLSPATADEWAGPFAGVFQHIGIGLSMLFALMAVYASVYVVGYLGGWITWLLDQARKTVDLVLQFVQAIPVVIVLIAILAAVLLATITQTGDDGRSWIEETIANMTSSIQCMVDGEGC